MLMTSRRRRFCAYRGWGTFREGTDCRRWLFAICRNTFLRTRHRERHMVAVDDPEAEVSATTQLYWDAVGSGLDEEDEKKT